MGPQLDSCGRLRDLYGDEPQGVLQWGRNLTVAEGLPPSMPDMKKTTLQWGRNLTVAEGISPWFTKNATKSFNGAAT